MSSPMTAGFSLSSFILASVSASPFVVTPEAPLLPWGSDLPFFGEFFTNSVLYTWIITLFIVGVLWRVNRNLQEIPQGLQNFVEFLIESLEKVAKGLLEPQVARWAFPLIATYFIFILLSNLAGLLPGVGSIGWGTPDPNSFFGVDHVDLPLLRPPTADANMTIAMSLIFFIACWYWAFRFNGFVGLLKHIFAPKGGFKGLVYFLLFFLFIPIGLLELISISIRPVALATRLYGNIYGGETVLTVMLGLLPWGIAAIPFYFLETLVAVVQTLVFTLLCFAFTGTLCSHHEEHEHEAEEASEKLHPEDAHSVTHAAS